MTFEEVIKIEAGDAVFHVKGFEVNPKDDY